MVATSSSAGKDEKKGRRKFSRFLFWPLLGGFLGICVYLLFFSPFLHVDNIIVEGNEDVSSQDIAGTIETSLEKKYFNILTQGKYFLVSKNNIGFAVKDNFSRLEVVAIEKKFPRTIYIKVIERKAEMVWCSGGACYFVDKNGLAYGGADAGEEDLRAGNFLVVVDESAIPVEIGKTKINPSYIEFIEAADAMIRDDLKLETVESYRTPGIASQEISGRTGEGWILKISLEYSIDEAKKIIQMLFEKDLNQEVRKNLDYLDLRIRNKIYYKIKQENEEPKSE